MVQMRKVLRVALGSALLAGVCLWGSVAAQAQSGDELEVRLNQLEEQMRQMTGQMEELTYRLKKTQDSLEAMAAEKPSAPLQKRGAADSVPGVSQEATIIASGPAPRTQALATTGGEGSETITGSPSDGVFSVTDDNTGEPVTLRKASAPKNLGTIPATSPSGDVAAADTPVAFQGQVVVPASAQRPSDVQSSGQLQSEPLAALETTPEATYEQAYENLLRRHFTEAEDGFNLFLQKYRDHSLAGNAQYWLGETYFAQGNFREAAKAFLAGYKDFGKSRKAPDSLVKLGVSLLRLDQHDQACAAFAAVGDKFPKAAEARKRAHLEEQRAGC